MISFDSLWFSLRGGKQVLFLFDYVLFCDVENYVIFVLFWGSLRISD